MKKVYVLDTSVLLYDPFAVFAFADNEVVVPVAALEEVDSKKGCMDEIGKNARQVDKIIYEQVENGGQLRVEMDCGSSEKSKEKTIENRIVLLALTMSSKEKLTKTKRSVVLVSKDPLMRVKADMLGVISQDYMKTGSLLRSMGL